MKLDSLTEDQRMSVEHVCGPLLISAGAGSGKTFTLTQRIAYALLHGELSGVEDIDEVLAITFTEKAAEEIKARVKGSLRLEGLNEQALRVDGAWISTIHGMCSRILHTHALEIGIDPQFEVLDEAGREVLLDEAINEALSEEGGMLESGRFQHLFNEYKPRSSQYRDASVESMVRAIISSSTSLRRGLNDLSFGPEPRPVSEMVRELFVLLESMQSLLESAGSSASAQNARDRLECDTCEVGRFLMQKEKNFSYADFAALLDSVHFIPRTFGSKDIKEQVHEYQEKLFSLTDEVFLSLARPIADELLLLSQETLRHYEDKKKSLFFLDNDDLLRKTYETFEAHPEIAEFYARKFKLVMVDEFQDTNQLQIDIITKLSGPNLQHLCTVGDSQQSIYRFRGADVAVYEEHKKSMQSPSVSAMYRELKKNFRSHQDILCFVDYVFSQDHVFGNTFMSLSAHDERKTTYKASAPRIDILLSTYSDKGIKKISSQEAIQAEAESIARRFSSFREAGHSSNDMVVLLGKMTHADIYAEALRAEGFDCVVAGGSLFSRMPDVGLVARLAEALVNPRNSDALYEVLSSDIFRLSADELLYLSTMEGEDGSPSRRCDLYTGFMRLKNLEALENKTPCPKLNLAVRVLHAAWDSLGACSLSETVKAVLVDSGILTRLESEGAFGLARAGNILKAHRLIEYLEQDRHMGPAQASFELSSQIDIGLKEPPGALSGSADSAIRIMTIHASKGLEFPIVALAEFAGSKRSRQTLAIETARGKAFASLGIGRTKNSYENLKKYTKRSQGGIRVEGDKAGMLEGATSLMELRGLLESYGADEEHREDQRKLYVGLTRTSEAFICAMTVRLSSKNPFDSYRGLVNDIRKALWGDEDFPEEGGEFDYGGTEPARYERQNLDILLQFEEEPAGCTGFDLKNIPADQGFFVPLSSETPSISCVLDESARRDIFSYSSLQADSISEEQLSYDSEDQQGKHENGRAVDMGTAFHRLAQIFIETSKVPSESEIDNMIALYALSGKQARRLRDALHRWLESDLQDKISQYTFVRAELPFFVAIGDEYLEGEIDLFCCDADKQSAFIVDYKTGGFDTENEDELYEKHVLQASCYAYASLLQGFASVELCFVRVEQESSHTSQEPQGIYYQFSASEKDILYSRILAARQN